ncbi:MAG TPA: hypothetical protein DCS05_04210 [Nitrospiraceae bacterium]|nr:hypothetical protein [Nitrospiraceae bacterium]
MPETFPLNPWFSVSIRDVGYKTDISGGHGGKEWRDSIVSVSRYEFSFPLKVITTANLDTFVAFMQARKGSFEAFNFTRPARFVGDSPVTYLVRSMMDDVSYEWARANFFSATVKFIEDK